MKIVTFILALATATLAVVCVMQSQKLRERDSQLVAAREQSEQNAAEIERLEAEQKHARATRDALLHQSDELAAELRKQKPAIAPAVAATNPTAETGESAKPGAEAGFGKMISKMMQDPEMKKFMKTQQRLVADQMYGPLAKKLSLSPEETDKFKSLIAENMMGSAEKASSLFGDGASTNRTEAIASIAANQKDFDAQMKEFLGEARYAEYKDYQQTVGERMQLNMFRQQGGSGENALNDQQTDQLLALMKEEKAGAAARGESVMTDTQDAAKLQSLLADGQTDKLMQSQESINQRVYDRAKDILTPAQLDSFGTFQTNQLAMMRMGMNMAKKMFAPETGATEAAR